MKVEEWASQMPLGRGYLDLAEKVRRLMMREFRDSMNRGVMPQRTPQNKWLHDCYYHTSVSSWDEASMEPLAKLLPKGPMRDFYVALPDNSRQVQMRNFMRAMERGVQVPRTQDKEWLFVLMARSSNDQWREASGEDYLDLV